LDILLASESGFCFGVRRALDTAREATEEHGRIYSLGPLIHNRQVVEDLAARGVEVVADLVRVSPGSVAMIRTHGAGPETYTDAHTRDIKLIDATCPFVERVQKAAARYQTKGYQVLVLGEADHPEARAIVEHTGGAATIVQGAEDLANLNIGRRVAVRLPDNAAAGESGRRWSRLSCRSHTRCASRIRSATQPPSGSRRRSTLRRPWT